MGIFDKLKLERPKKYIPKKDGGKAEEKEEKPSVVLQFGNYKVGIGGEEEKPEAEHNPLDDYEGLGFRRIKYTVVGVTFNDRQKNLASLKYNWLYEATFEHYEFEGKPAVKVLINGLDVGNLPEDKISYFNKIESGIDKSLAKVRKFKNEEGKLIYTCYLDVYFYYNAKEKKENNNGSSKE